MSKKEASLIRTNAFTWLKVVFALMNAANGTKLIPKWNLIQLVSISIPIGKVLTANRSKQCVLFESYANTFRLVAIHLIWRIVISLSLFFKPINCKLWYYAFLLKSWRTLSEKKLMHSKTGHFSSDRLFKKPNIVYCWIGIRCRKKLNSLLLVGIFLYSSLL